MNNYDEYLFYDKPIPYKELLIYPVKMADYFQFHLNVNCLLLDKNSVPTPEIISMSYLQFLYYMAQQGEVPYLYMFKELLKMVLHIEDDESFYFGLNENQKAYFKINDNPYDSNDFDKIVDIIFMQNSIEHIDDTVQKEIREAMEKAEAYKLKQNANKMGSLEDQMICVLISTSLSLDNIYDLTIRKFERILQRVDHKLHYQIYLEAQMSGMVKFKDESALKHWMCDLTKTDKYQDVKVDMSKMRETIESVNK